MCSSLYQAQIAECGAKSECRENKEEERQTEREGFDRRFMHVFILKRTEGTCSFKANKSCGNITKTYFRHYGSKRFFSLIIFHIHRVACYEFFQYAFKSNRCGISYSITFPIKVMDHRVFTRTVKINQSWDIPESGKPYRIQLLLKSTTGVPSLSLPDPTPSLIFLLTSLCAVQPERLEQESERLEQASV